MNDMSRYEEVPQKKNPFAKVFGMFGKYIRGVLYDFFTSFKFNNMKLPGWLIALPGVLIGFFLMFHAPVIKSFAWNADEFVPGEGIVEVSYLDFDYSGIVVFLLMLFGILNIFTAASVMKKKNLGSVIVATITTLVIVVCGVLYLYLIFYYQSLVNSGTITVLDNNHNPVTELNFDTKYIMSILSIVISMVSSVVGVILGFIFYDRTYEKVDR